MLLNEADPLDLPHALFQRLKLALILNIFTNDVLRLNEDMPVTVTALDEVVALDVKALKIHVMA